MKRILPLILAAAMTLTAGTAALADNVSDALEKAATMTNDELYAKAQEEMAAGAQLNFYSTTSFAEKAAANFMRAYPALDGKVVYAEIDDGESYTILTNTIGSGVKDSADMALTQNGADQILFLLIRGFGTGAMHVVCGNVYGGALRPVWDSRPLRAACLFALLCVAIIYHAIYNLLVSAGGTPQLIAYFVPLPTALCFRLKIVFQVQQMELGLHHLLNMYTN